MITLTRIDQLSTLPVPALLGASLHDQLITQPFGTQEAAQATWQELDNRLIVLDRADDPYRHSNLGSSPTYPSPR